MRIKDRMRTKKLERRRRKKTKRKRKKMTASPGRCGQGGLRPWPDPTKPSYPYLPTLPSSFSPTPTGQARRVHLHLFVVVTISPQPFFVVVAHTSPALSLDVVMHRKKGCIRPRTHRRKNTTGYLFICIKMKC